jgi:hypothetical protein
MKITLDIEENKTTLTLFDGKKKVASETYKEDPDEGVWRCTNKGDEFADKVREYVEENDCNWDADTLLDAIEDLHFPLMEMAKSIY